MNACLRLSSNRWLQTGALVLAVVAATGPSSALEEPLYAIPSAEDGRRLTFATCSESESWHECVSHDLSCGADGYNFSMMISGYEEGGGVSVRKIAKQLIDMPWSQAAATFLLASGKIRVELPISSISISPNDMNGDWDLEMSFYNRELLFGALNEASVMDVKVDVGGLAFNLTPSAPDGSKLIELKKACEAKNK